MKKTKPKIFISYTVRDGKIDNCFLTELFHHISSVSVVYIDLIHNDSVDKQNRVISELNSSDVIVLIRTEQTDNSEWVVKEISLAKELDIPIIEFEFEELIKNRFLPIVSAIKSSSYGVNLFKYKAYP